MLNENIAHSSSVNDVIFYLKFASKESVQVKRCGNINRVQSSDFKYNVLILNCWKRFKYNAMFMIKNKDEGIIKHFKEKKLL